MKKINLIIFCLCGILLKTHSQSEPCDINVDSVFNEHLSYLSNLKAKKYLKKQGDTCLYVKICGKIEVKKFMSMFSVLTSERVEMNYDPHICYLKKSIVNFMIEWYNEKKHLITCEKLKKAYDIIIFKGVSIEDLLEWNKEVDEFKLE